MVVTIVIIAKRGGRLVIVLILLQATMLRTKVMRRRQTYHYHMKQIRLHDFSNKYLGNQKRDRHFLRDDIPFKGMVHLTQDMASDDDFWPPE